MRWDRKRHPLETIIVTLSIAIFAGGIGVAAWLLSRQAAVAGAAALGAIVVGWIVIRQADAQPGAGAFVPVAFESHDELLLTDEVLLLTEEYVEPIGELLLDDALAPPAAQSRVVRLFESAPVNATPSELLGRINDYLGDRQAVPSLAGPAVSSLPDASEELYAALASIRASLR